MYTQCAKCETVFRLSAEVLRAAGGQVRCGRCGDVFNALAQLAERPDAFAVGESSLELESRADRILARAADEAAQPQTADEGVADGAFSPIDTSGVQLARLELTEAAPDDGAAALEFTLPPGELDRIFVEAGPAPHVLAPAPEFAPPHSAVAAAAAFDASDLEAAGAALLRTRPRERRFAAFWWSTVILLTLGLAAQIVHQNRGWLAAQGPFGAALRTLYARLGVDLPVPANLSAYQLRQWGVTGGANARGTLRVRASILNTAAQFQPLPLLRVTLIDRFGHRVGARDFAPSEYLVGRPAALMAPGVRADATIDIVDPGKNAEGYEIDVCLRDARRLIHCQNDVAAHGQ